MAWFRSSQTQQAPARPATMIAPPAPPTAPASPPATPAAPAAAPAPARPGDSMHGTRTGHGHAMPVIGYPEAYYLKHVKEADERGDQLGHDAFKVGQYLTLGMGQKEPPERKAKYFGHALRRHASPPPDADAHVRDYYHRLGDL